MRVAILGASPKSDRYAYMAQQLLLQYGHEVFPIHPVYKEIEGLRVYPDLASLAHPIHTVTLYIGAQRLPDYVHALIAIKPQRVIFNPGTENPEVMDALENAGVEVVEGCTLVMLRTRQF